jgi:hypothetical protein
MPRSTLLEMESMSIVIAELQDFVEKSVDAKPRAVVNAWSLVNMYVHTKSPCMACVFFSDLQVEIDKLVTTKLTDSKSHDMYIQSMSGLLGHEREIARKDFAGNETAQEYFELKEPYSFHVNSFRN